MAINATTASSGPLSGEARNASASSGTYGMASWIIPPTWQVSARSRSPGAKAFNAVRIGLSPGSSPVPNWRRRSRRCARRTGTRRHAGRSRPFPSRLRCRTGLIRCARICRARPPQRQAPGPWITPSTETCVVVGSFKSTAPSGRSPSLPRDVLRPALPYSSWVLRHPSGAHRSPDR